jgi:hypothetical protein
MVALLAFITSRDVAIVAGPYAAIVILACAGAALSLSGAEERMSPFAGAWFIFVRVFIAVAITVALAEGMQWFFPQAGSEIHIGPNRVRDRVDQRLQLGARMARWIDRPLRIEEGVRWSVTPPSSRSTSRSARSGASSRCAA